MQNIVSMKLTLGFRQLILVFVVFAIVIFKRLRRAGEVVVV